MSFKLPSEPQSEVTDRHLEQYDRDGFTCLRGVFHPDWIDYMRDAVEKAAAQPGPLAQVYTKPGDRGRSWGDHAMWERIPEFKNFILHSPAAAIAARLTGSPHVNLFYDHLIVKEPDTEQRTPWHQDQPYWAVQGWQIITLWTPFDRVPAHNSLEVIRGTHRGETYNPFHFTTREPFKGTGLPSIPDIEANRQDYEVVAYDMEPGDCLVLHAMTIHGAPGNSRSQERRRVLITHWAGEDARYKKMEGELAINAKDPGLRDGDPLDGCPHYPRAWPQESRAGV